jgi:hypothetical protein
VLLIGFGVVLLYFGLYFFYTFLPVVYAFLGFGIGFRIGAAFDNGNFGTLALIVGVIVAALAGLFALAIDKFARSLIGAFVGAAVGAVISHLINVSGIGFQFSNLKNWKQEVA